MFDVVLQNRTPFLAENHVQMDQNGQEVLISVLSATFARNADDLLELAAEQVPVCLCDEPFGEPGRSSIRIEADVVAEKPRVDVVLNGAAYAPQGRPVTALTVTMRFADIHKALRVTGDQPPDNGGPLPFGRMPIVYERAFGGTTEAGDVYLENPVGVGYRDSKSADPAVSTELPNLEYPDRSPSGRGDHSAPAGFGVIARNWAPRLALAGTYDQAWLETVWPLPPGDFNPLFNQIAPQDQQIPAVSGGELVELTNLTPSGLWHFRLPRIEVPVRLIFDDRVEERDSRVDTVLIDAERQLVTLKSRIAVKKVRNAPRLRELVLGHVTPAWLNARRQRKKYRSLRGGNGTLSSRPLFWL